MTKAERNVEIVRLRKEGLYPTEIARRLGITRNAVIGALNRAGMCDPNIDRSAVNKKFAARGEACHTAKLSTREVREIRSLYKPYDRQFGASALARRYGLAVNNLLAAVHGKSWAHVA